MEFIFALPNILIAQVFIISSYLDYKPATKAMIIEKLKEQGLPYPDKAMMAGLIFKTLAAFGLLFTATVHFAAYGLIVFTAIATFIFLPFWKKSAAERDFTLVQFCTCLGIMGGLFALTV